MKYYEIEQFLADLEPKLLEKYRLRFFVGQCDKEHRHRIFPIYGSDGSPTVRFGCWLVFYPANNREALDGLSLPRDWQGPLVYKGRGFIGIEWSQPPTEEALSGGIWQAADRLTDAVKQSEVPV
jgi:hypothetical protein